MFFIFENQNKPLLSTKWHRSSECIQLQMTENQTPGLCRNWFLSIVRSLEVVVQYWWCIFSVMSSQGLRFPGVFWSVIFSLWLSFSWSQWMLYLQASLTVDFRLEEEGKEGARRELTLGSENRFFSEEFSWHIIGYAKRNIFLCGNIAPLNKIRLLVSKNKWRLDIKWQLEEEIDIR